MLFREFVVRWQGTFLCLIASTAIAWLDATNQLNLYIHPRYITFTVVLAWIAIVLSVLSFKYRHPLDSAESASPIRITTAVGASVMCATSIIGMLVVRPALLTSSSAVQRGINSGVGTEADITSSESLFRGVNSEGFAIKDWDSLFESFTIKEWATLLTQTNELSNYVDKQVDLVGFITPDPQDPQNVFFVSRFVMTCCAVDARPIGVPVYAPRWQDTYHADDWIHIKGSFIASPSPQSTHRVAIEPVTLSSTPQPQDPYVY